MNFQRTLQVDLVWLKTCATGPPKAKSTPSCPRWRRSLKVFIRPKSQWACAASPRCWPLKLFQGASLPSAMTPSVRSEYTRRLWWYRCIRSIIYDLSLGCRWPHAGVAKSMTELGCRHMNKNVGEVHVDKKNKLVTTSAFMCNAPIHEIFDGLGVMVSEVLKLAWHVSCLNRNVCMWEFSFGETACSIFIRNIRKYLLDWFDQFILNPRTHYGK